VNYQPIVTPLSPTSEAADVLRGLRTLAPFPIVYIADLDAISGEGGHGEVLRALVARTRGVEFWLDGGFASAASAQGATTGGVVPVLGSESLSGTSELAKARAMLLGTIVLSLDYRAGRFMGAPEIEHQPDLWPGRIILMTLDRVGTGSGPDFEALESLVRRAAGRAVFAAGGVRDEADLDRLQAIGAAGVLVATALHDGRLSAAAISRFHR
jgi:phosphoribosylformimino-5-aminoimidazole carboxamide ribotide isomerase